MARRSFPVLLAFACAVAACQCEPPAAVVGTLRLTADSLDFGEVALGAHQDATVSVENTSVALVRVSAIGLEGEHAAQFSVIAPPSIDLAPGASLTATVRYAPTQARQHLAQLVFTHDAEGGPRAVVRLSGVGVARDPCACDTPPGPCFEAKGTCSGGACTYAPLAVGSACSDGSGCTTGDACDASGKCQGTARTCDSPPASTCSSGTTAQTWATPGTCDAATGQCKYQPQSTTCANGCDASTGACKGCPAQTCGQLGRECGSQTDTCGNTLYCGTCNSPPAQACVNTNTSRTYAASGTCSSAGKCSYAATDTTCTNGCDGTTGKCRTCAAKSCRTGVDCGTSSDGCGGTIACGGCNAPPAPTCVTSTTSRTYSATGLCNAGTCDYSFVDTTCSAGCDSAAGKCKTCSPKSCRAGIDCGAIPDGCGSTVTCGGCNTGYTCTSGTCTQTSACQGSCTSWTDCGTGTGCDTSKGCCVPCGGDGQPCCVDWGQGLFFCNSTGLVCGRSSGSGSTASYYCCKNAGDGCCSQGGCGGGTCCKCPRNGLNACVQPSFGCGGC